MQGGGMRVSVACTAMQPDVCSCTHAPFAAQQLPPASCSAASPGHSLPLPLLACPAHSWWRSACGPTRHPSSCCCAAPPHPTRAAAATAACCCGGGAAGTGGGRACHCRQPTRHAGMQARHTSMRTAGLAWAPGQPTHAPAPGYNRPLAGPHSRSIFCLSAAGVSRARPKSEGGKQAPGAGSHARCLSGTGTQPGGGEWGQQVFLRSARPSPPGCTEHPPASLASAWDTSTCVSMMFSCGFGEGKGKAAGKCEQDGAGPALLPPGCRCTSTGAPFAFCVAAQPAATAISEPNSVLVVKILPKPTSFRSRWITTGRAS